MISGINCKTQYMPTIIKIIHKFYMSAIYIWSHTHMCKYIIYIKKSYVFYIFYKISHSKNKYNIYIKFLPS